MGMIGIVVTAVCIAVIQSVLLGVWSLKRVSYSRRFNATSCYAGDTIELVEEIANAKPLPIMWLRTESTLDANLQFGAQLDMRVDQGTTSQHHKSLFTLMPYRRIRRRHTIVCASRGVYRLGSVAMSAGDPLGLRTVQRQFAVDGELTVYPRIVPMADIPLPSRDWQGDLVVKRWIVEDPFLVSGVRSYRYGDPMNQIHWKATARTGKLQVYRRDFTSDHRLYLFVNVETAESMRGVVADTALIERGISFAATLASDAVGKGLTVGFGHNAHSLDRTEGATIVPAAGGKAHLNVLLETMARMELKHRFMFHDVIAADGRRAVERRDYLFITAHMSAAIAEQAAQLKYAGHSVRVLMLSRNAGEERVIAV